MIRPKITDIAYGLDHRVTVLQKKLDGVGDEKYNVSTIEVSGSNGSGQLGLGKNIETSDKTTLFQLAGYEINVFAGPDYTLFLFREKSSIDDEIKYYLFGCGNNNKFQLAKIKEENKKPVDLIPNIYELEKIVLPVGYPVDVVCGEDYVFCMNNLGYWYGWGNNNKNQIVFDNPHNDEYFIMWRMQHIPPFSTLRVGLDFVYALSGKKVFAWGNNEQSQLWIKSNNPQSPVTRLNMKNVKDIIPNYRFTVAKNINPANNQTYYTAWGVFNDFFQVEGEKQQQLEVPIDYYDLEFYYENKKIENADIEIRWHNGFVFSDNRLYIFNRKSKVQINESGITKKIEIYTDLVAENVFQIYIGNRKFSVQFVNDSVVDFSTDKEGRLFAM